MAAKKYRNLVCISPNYDQRSSVLFFNTHGEHFSAELWSHNKWIIILQTTVTYQLKTTKTLLLTITLSFIAVNNTSIISVK